MPSRRKKEVAYIISFLLYLAIFLMSSLPASALPAKLPDIIPHFCEYAILAFFFIQTFNNPTNTKTMAIGLAWLILLSFLDELHQMLVPSRFCSAKDLMFDTLGSLSGLTAYFLLRRWSVRRRTDNRLSLDQE